MSRKRYDVDDVPRHLPPFLNGIWLDKHTTWLDEPWWHVAVIVLCLVLAWLVFFR